MPDSIGPTPEQLERVRTAFPHLHAVHTDAGLATDARNLEATEVIVYGLGDIADAANAEAMDNPGDGELFLYALERTKEHSEGIIKREEARIAWIARASTAAREAMVRHSLAVAP